MPQPGVQLARTHTVVLFIQSNHSLLGSFTPLRRAAAFATSDMFARVAWPAPVLLRGLLPDLVPGLLPGLLATVLLTCTCIAATALLMNSPRHRGLGGLAS